MPKQSISVTLEPGTIDCLRQLAAEEHRNISNMIDYIVAQYAIQKNISNAEKQGHAALFGNSVKVTSYSQTQKKLENNVHIDEADLAFVIVAQQRVSSTNTYNYVKDRVEFSR